MNLGKIRRFGGTTLLTLACAALLGQNAAAQDGSAELAQELTNPVANLITLPIQMNFDYDIGPEDDGARIVANVQPLIPFEINDDWNLITRTIAPITRQKDVVPGAGSAFGLGDINMSLFFSPRKAASDGFVWGAGPVFLLPTATDVQLGAKKWGTGPAGIGLMLRGPWTFGMLANHVWSFAGESDRQDISNTFMQPFVAYTTPNAVTFSLQTETSYNWELAARTRNRGDS